VLAGAQPTSLRKPQLNKSKQSIVEWRCYRKGRQQEDWVKAEWIVL
jgi:hypothetical protein